MLIFCHFSIYKFSFKNNKYMSFYIFQITFSYSRYSKEEVNVVKIDGFDHRIDPTRCVKYFNLEKFSYTGFFIQVVPSFHLSILFDVIHFALCILFLLLKRTGGLKNQIQYFYRYFLSLQTTSKDTSNGYKNFVGIKKLLNF